LHIAKILNGGRILLNCYFHYKSETSICSYVIDGEVTGGESERERMCGEYRERSAAVREVRDQMQYSIC
jgi:hypothetical protein